MNTASEGSAAASRDELSGGRGVEEANGQTAGHEAADAADAAEAADAAVAAAGRAAQAAAGRLGQMPADGLDEALRAIAARLAERAAEVIAANADDVRAARADGLAAGFVDRLTLDRARVDAMADQLRALADVPAEPARNRVRDPPHGL
jgi:glutamate-5-semialdehyde dehydrogenase